MTKSNSKEETISAYTSKFWSIVEGCLGRTEAEAIKNTADGLALGLHPMSMFLLHLSYEALVYLAGDGSVHNGLCSPIPIINEDNVPQTHPRPNLV